MRIGWMPMHAHHECASCMRIGWMPMHAHYACASAGCRCTRIMHAHAVCASAFCRCTRIIYICMRICWMPMHAHYAYFSNLYISHIYCRYLRFQKLICRAYEHRTNQESRVCVHVICCHKTYMRRLFGLSVRSVTGDVGVLNMAHTQRVSRLSCL